MDEIRTILDKMWSRKFTEYVWIQV
jgi:hypothetical protein